jgi:hypothetical protein
MLIIANLVELTKQLPSILIKQPSYKAMVKRILVIILNRNLSKLMQGIYNND